MSFLSASYGNPAQTFEQKKSAGFAIRHSGLDQPNISYGKPAHFTQASVDMLYRNSPDTAILLLLVYRCRGSSSSGD